MGLSKQVWYNWYAGLVAAGCIILMGYDSSVFNSVQASQNWKSAMGDPDPYMIGLVNTVYTIGAIITGWFLSGPTSDYLGRRIGMGIGCMITVVATVLQAFPPANGSLACFMVGRVLIGVGTALATSNFWPHLHREVTASRIRGKVKSFWQMFFSVESFLAYWFNFACARNRASLGHWDWKMVVIFQLMMPLIICAQLPFLPESPRWLIAKKNDYKGAKAALMRVRSTEEVDAEILSIRKAIAYEKEAAPRKHEAYMALIKDKAIRKHVILAFIINNVFNNVDTVNLINALNRMLGILFTLKATWTVDRFGRKWPFMVGATGMAICTMLIGVVGLTTLDINGSKTYSVGVGIATLAFAFAFFFKPSWGAVVWIHTLEIFPMHVRARVPACLKVLFFFMTTNVLLTFFTYLFLPETKNVTLEQMDTLFGGVDHVAKGPGLVEDMEHTAPITLGNENKPESVALETVTKKQESV
ncbi:general substrate transporter [Parathielavia appendiculata]|uniref:General substrate transporter n=1 Tax=Parathielavia appendiculata TaxID=2587402 RepID=A0AAN6U6Z5_9PEZI|nr:general substrate transporter [Parathielavia appendiculata]